MSIVIRPAALLLGLFGFVAAAQAQPAADHMQCFKIKDAAAKALYHADLAPTDPTFPLAAGCTVRVPARLLCVDVVKSNVEPTPPGSPEAEPARPYLCYKTTCPKAQPQTTVTDQFGTHAVLVKATNLLCAPVDVPAEPSCTDGLQNGSETGVDCGGGSCPACANGQGCAADSDCLSLLCSGGVCATPSCTDGLQNGSETGVDCGGGSCPACAVGEQCQAASDCTSGQCSGGVCVLAGDGTACSLDPQCASGFCVDGVCCDTSCAGLCQACTVAKKGSGVDGTCGSIATGSDPDSECTDSGAASCGTNGTCSGAGSCALYSAGTQCVAPSCSGGSETLASQCNGTGTCVSGGTQSCSPYACGPTACLTICATDGDCASGFTCQAGACQ